MRRRRITRWRVILRKPVEPPFKNAAAKIKHELPFIKEVFLVGGRAAGKKSGDVDIELICDKPLDKFSVDEYARLLTVEESLTREQGLNFELYVRRKGEFLKRPGYGIKLM